jgi:hypothetical protein
LVALDVIALGLEILLTPASSFYVAYFGILPSPNKSFFLSGFRYSVSSYPLLYPFSDNNNIIKMLSRASHQVLIVWRFESIGE